MMIRYFGALAFVLGSVIPGHAFGKVVCQNSGLVRTIDVAYEGLSNRACQVAYVKETEDPGNVHTPWYAENNRDFCQPKADYLRDKLVGLGWDCNQEAKSQ